MEIPLRIKGKVMDWLVWGGVALVALYVLSTYNGIVTLRARANQALADIDVQLKQRHDLIPNLIETVKGSMGHERETLQAVVETRNAALRAQGPADQAASEGALSGALSRLLSLSEAYPDLKASANFQQLQTDLADIEDKLAAARRFFNNAVAEYNAGIQRFPAVLFAGLADFQPQSFFDVGETQRKTLETPPKVAF
jgi:LemA protein